MKVRELKELLDRASNDVLDAELWTFIRAELHVGLNVNIHSRVEAPIGFLEEHGKSRFYIACRDK